MSNCRIIPPHKKSLIRAQGFTLIELMIASALSLIIALSLLKVFGISIGTAVFQTSMGSIQQDSVVLVDILSTHIRMAGFQEDHTVDGRLANAVSGTEGGTGTDSITVRSLSAESSDIYSTPIVDCMGIEYPGGVGSATETVYEMSNTFLSLVAY